MIFSSRIAGTMSWARPSGLSPSTPECLRQGADESDVRIVLLEASPETGDRAASAHPGNHVGEPTAGLDEDLLRRRLVVRAPVIVVAVLVAEEIAIRIGSRAATHLAQRLVVTQQGVRHYETRAVCAQPLLALGACVGRNHDLDGQTDHPADHRIGDTGIPGRTVQDSLAAPEPP